MYRLAHCHSPVLQRHRPFLGRRLDCQPHHFFTESSVGNTLYFGSGRGLTWYNFISEQYSGFHGIVVPGTKEWIKAE
ncbi:hypothetical protein ET266_24100 [Escherichia coli]|nr:hypothetical protein [Escherichia coli]EEV5743822.1 hypothetical protein [Escherichia coli]EEV5758628.1 hypothetical protein [Escherichia coli]EEV6645152.1 hypothetical protein [Escherichia coli]EEV6707149.1 hypothetical protein [Escherichia coli]